MKKDYYEQIQIKDEKSAKIKEEIDRETSSEKVKEDMWNRVMKLNKLKDVLE